MFHFHAHGHHPVLLAIVIGIALLGSLSTIADLSEADKRITLAILECLALVQMTHKVAYSLMDISKSQWSKVLSCDLHVSLTRLRRLGLPFNALFMPRYLQIVADEFARGVVESAEERRGVHAA
jgi:hypothetical protein